MEKESFDALSRLFNYSGYISVLPKAVQEDSIYNIKHLGIQAFGIRM